MVLDEKRKRILWIEPDRFDLKKNKSPWLEMSDRLSTHRFDVEILTGFSRERYQPTNKKVIMTYISAPDITWLYRYGLLFKMLLWLIRN